MDDAPGGFRPVPMRVARAIPRRDQRQNHPQLLDPPSGRIWTATQSHLDPRQAALIGADLATLVANTICGARAPRSRDEMLSLTTPRRADMLRIQLDDRALFLQRWHDLLLQLLDADAIALHRPRGSDRAADMERPTRAFDALAYRLVRGFRDARKRSVWNMLMAR